MTFLPVVFLGFHPPSPFLSQLRFVAYSLNGCGHQVRVHRSSAKRLDPVVLRSEGLCRTGRDPL